MKHTSLHISITGKIAKGICPELWVYTALPARENEHVLCVHWDDRSLHVSLDLCHVLRTCWLTNVWFGEIEKSTITLKIVTLPHNEWSIFLYTHLGGAFVVCILLSSAPWRFEHCGFCRWLQTSCRWSVVLRSRIWSYPGRDKFVCQWCLPSRSTLYSWGPFFRKSPVV